MKGWQDENLGVKKTVCRSSVSNCLQTLRTTAHCYRHVQTSKAFFLSCHVLLALTAVATKKATPMQAFLVNAGRATLLFPSAGLLHTKKAAPVQSVSAHAWCATLLC